MKFMTPSAVTSDLTVREHFKVLASMGVEWWYGLLPQWAVKRRIARAFEERLEF